MTQQRAHSFRIDDQRWFIRAWEGPRDVIPESEALGFATRMRSTANRSGRIDTFVVDDRRLRLHSIEAHLTDEHADFVPKDGERRDITTRSWSRGAGPRGIVTSTAVHLLFHGLWIPFTGRIGLWQQDRDLTLAFDRGTLVGRSARRDAVPEE